MKLRFKNFLSLLIVLLCSHLACASQLEEVAVGAPVNKQPTLEDYFPNILEYKATSNYFVQDMAVNPDNSVVAYYDQEDKVLHFKSLLPESSPAHKIPSNMEIVVGNNSIGELMWTFNPTYMIAALKNEKSEHQLILINVENGMQLPFSDWHYWATVSGKSRKYPNKVVVAWRDIASKKDPNIVEVEKPEATPKITVSAGSTDQSSQKKDEGKESEPLKPCGPETVVAATYDLISGKLDIIGHFENICSRFIIDQDLKIRAAIAEVQAPCHSAISIMVPDKHYKQDIWRKHYLAEGEGGQLSICGASRDLNFIYFLDGRPGNNTRLYKINLNKMHDVQLVKKIKGEDIAGILSNKLDDETDEGQQIPDYLGVMVHANQLKCIDTDDRLKGLIQYLVGNRERMCLSSFLDCYPGIFFLNKEIALIRENMNSLVVFCMKRNQVVRSISLLPRLEKFVVAYSPVETGFMRSDDNLFDLSYYLTQPQAAPKPWPCVVMVHGGPRQRDDYLYDPSDQSLSKFLGVATLKVNYRGSTGFGKKFRFAGDGQWGKKILDDIKHVTAKFVENGTIDPARLMVMGGSFGGYVTYAMLAFHPGIFKGGISFNGDSDLVSAIKYEDSVLSERFWKYLMGGDPDIAEQKRDLQVQSPINFAQKINVPLLSIVGENDRTVFPQQSAMMVEKLKTLKRPVTHVVFSGEEHNFVKYDNIIAELALNHGFISQTLGLPGPLDLDAIFKKATDMKIVHGRDHLKFLKAVVEPVVRTEEKLADATENKDNIVKKKKDKKKPMKDEKEKK